VLRNRKIQVRTTWLVGAAACAMLVLAGRLAWLMTAHGEDLHGRSLGERMRTVPVMAPRGDILDRSGRILAESTTVYAAYAVPAEVRDKARAATLLAPILERSTAYLDKRLGMRAALVYLRRRLTPAQAQQVRQLALSGIGLAPEVQRVYPYGALASEVVGFTGIDGQGLAGVELTYDKELKGTNGAIRVEYDARNLRIAGARTTYEKAVPGDTVVLTLDVGLQEIAQEALREAMANSGADQGLVLMMDPNTGAILALAAAPTFNPAHYADYPPSRWKDPAVSNTYPPGSTFKPITVASGLQSGAVTPHTGFYDPGFFRVDGRAIRCWKGGGHGAETTQIVLRNSCNVALGEIGLRLGTQRFYQYLGRFGILAKTGVDLPGEGRAIVPPQKSVKPVDLAVMAFGQTLNVTAVQLADAISAIANGGNLVQPHIVQEVLSPRGKTLWTAPTRVRAHPISAEVAAQVRAMMVDVVTNGSGKPAKVPGYTLAGKTGTSQIVVGGRYEPGQYIASFIGYGPVPHPQVLALVVIDRPQGEHYGGKVAAPVFSRIMARALPYLGVAPSQPKNQAQGVRIVPQVAGRTPATALRLLRAAGLSPRVVGPTGAVVRATLPAAGERATGRAVQVFEGPALPASTHRAGTAPVS